MAVLKYIGSFLQSSGWTGAVAEAEVASQGTAESFLTASCVTKNREAYFKLYCQALAALIPFFFSNNNVNYARWLPVHLKDMLTLDVTHPNVYQAFQDGTFVVFKRIDLSLP